MPEKEKPEIPKRQWRQLKKLEEQMREIIPSWERTRNFQEKIEVIYAIKLMETFLSANLGAVGNVRDQAARGLLLEKLMEFYRW
jgi:hypothetical protein